MKEYRLTWMNEFSMKDLARDDHVKPNNNRSNIIDDGMDQFSIRSYDQPQGNH